MQSDLFSVILLHYNQPQYVYNAIDSVINQDYENIELVFADDASSDIDKEAIKEYIGKNKKDNIKNVIYSINEKNLGTVKTVNRAVKACSGQYIIFFAADDALYDSSVLSNFAKAFSEADENIYMISSQCHMMDINMNKELSLFVTKNQGEAFNKLSSKEQFKIFSETCFLAMGATAMKAEMFERFGYFNENYKYVEDWAYFLYLTRSGGLVKYVDFDGLLHRDGGISHNKSTDHIPPHVMGYKHDMISITENEILPFMHGMKIKTKLAVLSRYFGEKRFYKEHKGTDPVDSNKHIFLKHPISFIISFISPISRSFKFAKLAAVSSFFFAVLYFAVMFLLKSFDSKQLHITQKILGIMLAFFVCATFLLGIIRCFFIFVNKYGKILKRR